MLQTVRAEKVYEKSGVICADLSKKLKSESSHYTLSENDMVYRGLSHRS